MARKERTVEKRKADQPPEVASRPDLEFDEFRAAVDVIAGLVDNGNFLVFLNRYGQVRLIGDPADFRKALANQLKTAELGGGSDLQALEEIAQYLAVSIVESDVEKAASLLGHMSNAGKASEDASREARQRLEEKLEYVSKRLVTSALEIRHERLTTAVTPCVEDIDVELVTERRDQLQAKTIRQPFLRLRLRYSDPQSTNFLFPIRFMFVPVSSAGFGLKSVEFDVDESDIDLLIRRLVSARDVLLNAVIPNSQVSEGQDT